MGTLKVYSLEKYVKDALNELQQVVTSSPYLAFSNMSSLIELLGKCLSDRDLQESGHSSRDFADAIMQYDSLKKYRKYNTVLTNKKGENYNKNSLYNSLRCGLLHACMPQGNIVLSGKRNDLTKDIIGCEELFNDIKAAWDEAFDGSVGIKQNLTKNRLYVSDSYTAATSDVQYIETTLPREIRRRMVGKRKR